MVSGHYVFIDDKFEDDNDEDEYNDNDDDEYKVHDHRRFRVVRLGKQGW